MIAAQPSLVRVKMEPEQGWKFCGAMISGSPGDSIRLEITQKPFLSQLQKNLLVAMTGE